MTTSASQLVVYILQKCRLVSPVIRSKLMTSTSKKSLERVTGIILNTHCHTETANTDHDLNSGQHIDLQDLKVVTDKNC